LYLAISAIYILAVTKDHSKQYIIRKRQEKVEGISMRCVETWYQWRDEIAGKIKQ